MILADPTPNLFIVVGIVYSNESILDTSVHLWIQDPCVIEPALDAWLYKKNVSDLSFSLPSSLCVHSEMLETAAEAKHAAEAVVESQIISEENGYAGQ